MGDIFASADQVRAREKARKAADQDTLKRLLNTTDATVWADEFVKQAWKLGHVIDEDWMRGWFANAIEIGRLAGRVETASLRELMEAAAKRSASP